MKRWQKAVAAATLFLGASIGAAFSLCRTASTIPAGWPSTFTIGVSMFGGGIASQFTYLQSAGMPKWGALYVYLSGGINNGWQTFGAGFIANQVTKVRAAGALPVYTYYMQVGTPPNPNDGSPQTDLNTLATMQAYYLDFTALMKQLGAKGGPVTVHIEPDLWGYLERATGGLGASVIVASSGNADLASLPNTVAGLGQAFIHLRDLYAPNVTLAANVSSWSWNTSTNCAQNNTAIGQTDAAFMTGIGNWDLYFTDVAFGDNDGPRGTHWDTTNATCPNFNVLNTWAKAFTDATHKRLVLWQTPTGNTIYRTENDTPFHYQSNQLQYWLQNYPADGHLLALANSGVIAALFAGGEPSPTTVYDTAGDGVTNPAAINGNTTVSTSVADDGGFLILVTGAYNAAPLALH